MKLLIITAISEFEKEVKKMLKKASVKTYSHKNVVGYRDASQDSVGNNWFGSEMNQNESILFYAFIEKENIAVLKEEVTQFNVKQETLSHIHVAILNIEETI